MCARSLHQADGERDLSENVDKRSSSVLNQKIRHQMLLAAAAVEGNDNKVPEDADWQKSCSLAV